MSWYFNLGISIAVALTVYKATYNILLAFIILEIVPCLSLVFYITGMGILIPNWMAGALLAFPFLYICFRHLETEG